MCLSPLCRTHIIKGLKIGYFHHKNNNTFLRPSNPPPSPLPCVHYAQVGRRYEVGHVVPVKGIDGPTKLVRESLHRLRDGFYRLSGEVTETLREGGISLSGLALRVLWAWERGKCVSVLLVHRKEPFSPSPCRRPTPYNKIQPEPQSQPSLPSSNSHPTNHRPTIPTRPPQLSSSIPSCALKFHPDFLSTSICPQKNPPIPHNLRTKAPNQLARLVLRQHHSKLSMLHSYNP